MTLSDVIAQSKAVTSGDLTKLTGAVDKIMDPFPFGANGKIIISSVYVAQGETDAKVNWQCSFGSYSASSKLGAEGANAALPAGFTMIAKDNVIVTEIYYESQPLAPGVMFDNDEIYRRAMFKPRRHFIVDPGCASVHAEHNPMLNATNVIGKPMKKLCIIGKNMRKLWSCERGAVAPLVGFCAIMLVGAVAVAVDVGRGQVAQSKLQAALDSAGLAAGAVVSQNLEEEDLEDKGGIPQ